jgi:chlorobactene glucosyltransferase
MLIFCLSLLTIAVIGVVLRDLILARAVPLLEPVAGEQTPPVSVLIPARDEALRIGRLLDGLSAQTGTGVEVIVLDDHSSDGTAALAREWSDRIPGLRVLAGEALPPGWVGKCWACWQAAQASEHPWLLFLDADTAPAPALITTLIAHAGRCKVDFLSILPLLELESFAERLLLPPFGGIIQAVFPLNKINDPHSPIALANGQCILVRREVYFATGGHAAVRNSVLEDVSLAQTIKAAGYRVAIAAGPDLLRVRMYTRLGEIAEGLRKNAWAGYSAGGWRSLWGSFRQALLALAPLSVLPAGVVALASGYPGWPALIGFGLILILVTNLYWGFTVLRVYRLNPLWGLLFPFGTLAYFILAGLAWISIRRGRGVQWKGRAYRG